MEQRNTTDRRYGFLWVTPTGTHTDHGEMGNSQNWMRRQQQKTTEEVIQLHTATLTRHAPPLHCLTLRV